MTVFRLGRRCDVLCLFSAGKVRFHHRQIFFRFLVLCAVPFVRFIGNFVIVQHTVLGAVRVNAMEDQAVNMVCQFSIFKGK